MLSNAPDAPIHGSAGVAVTSAAVSVFDPTTLSIWLAIIAALVSISLGLHKWYLIVLEYRQKKNRRGNHVVKRRKRN